MGSNRYNKSLRGVGVAIGCIAGIVTAQAAPMEHIIDVPGSADFLAIDGDGAWVTNKGRVERWTRAGRTAEIPMTHPCGAMAIAAGALWVADCQAGTLNRIDLVTARITAVIATGIARPDGELNVVAGAGSIWVASDKNGIVARINPATDRVAARVKVDAGTSYLAFGMGALWAVSGPRSSVQKIDPQSNIVTRRTQLGRQPGFLAAGEGAVWVQEQGDGTVARIDPVSAMVSGRVKVDPSLHYGDIDTGGGKVWLRTTAGQSFVVIDPHSLAIVSRVGKAMGSGALRYTPNGLWTTAHDIHRLSWWDLAKPGTAQ